MRTNNRKLTAEEQAILRYVMYTRQLNQCIIAKQNNYNTSVKIHQIVTGKINVTEHSKSLFANCGIDLDEIMNFKTFKTKKVIKTRPLTPEECERVNAIIKSKKLSKEKIAAKAYTSKNIIYQICNGEYRITKLMKQHFLKSGINLDEIMGGSNGD